METREQVSQSQEATMMDKEKELMRAKLFGESSDEEDVEDDDLAKKRRQMKEKLAAMSKKKASKKRIKKAGTSTKRKREGVDSELVAGLDSENDSEGDLDDDDRAFIVNEPVEEGSVPWAGGDSDEEIVEYQEEAEEENIADFFKSKGKRKQRVLSLDEIRKIVNTFLERMENAVREDQLANERKEPALSKLKLTGEMETILCNLQLQEEFLDHGLLSVLNSWLERLPDGSLPNTKVRTSVLKVLDKLPIDLQHHDRKEQLKASMLGRTVMFLYKLPEETPLNKKLARDLVQKWSRPIFELSTRFRDLPRQGIVHSRRGINAIASAREDVDLEEDSDDDVQVGERSVGRSSRVPGTAYKQREIGSNLSAPPSEASEQTKKLQKKLQTMGKRKGRAGNKAGLSIEGRGLLL